MATAVVIGGGISGLSAAYYLQKLSGKIGKVILLESSKRTGGWMNSSEYSDGTVFEHGPRSMRPVRKSGKNTLCLVEELGLVKDLLVVHRSDAAAKNRYLYIGGQLCALPNSIGGVVKTIPPFSKPLLLSLAGDLFAKASTASDETVHNFISRRLGAEIADTAGDALCRGIFAGDCHTLSMRACFPDIFEMERKHGSLVMGMLKSKKSTNENEGFLEKRVKSEKWSAWSLRHGMEQLSRALTSAVTLNPLCEIRTDSACLALIPASDGRIKVKTDTEEIMADFVFSAIFSRDLASLLPMEFINIRSTLESISAASVYVVNLEFKGNHLPVQGFGHLLPSSESPHILGVIYDSCTFPVHNRKDCPSTRLTVILGGAWFHKLLTKTGNLPSIDDITKISTEAVQAHLGLASDLKPSKTKILLQKDCIPQYTLGHAEKVYLLDTLIQKSGLPLRLIGASYRGVSVNDCIYNARLEVEKLHNSFH